MKAARSLRKNWRNLFIRAAKIVHGFCMMDVLQIGQVQIWKKKLNNVRKELV